VTPALRRGRPIWLRRARRAIRTYPSLSGRHETTVAIVGGGITGALIAQAFASSGIATVVLEAAAVGRGSTAASSALLLQETDLELAQLTERYGSRASRRIWRLGHESVAALVALLTRLKIRCDLTTRDAIYYARDREGAERLRREFNLRRGAGFDADWLTPGALRNTTAISGRCGIRTHGNAQFDPYRACIGVLRSAMTAGAEIFERSAVRHIEAGRYRVRIRTRGGILDARHVIIATGYATPQFRPLAGRFRMYRTYVLATEPISAGQRDDLGLSDVMVWDTARPYHYARWTPDRRLLLGGGDRLVRPGPGRRRQLQTASSELREYFESLFPALTTIKTASAWEGLFAMTPDSLPYVGPHRRYPAHWFALGYGGNGMTFGMLAARLLLERWHGVKSQDQRLFAFDRMARASSAN
jgi:glycine/D-amino acid oxidase-like deaminating enzyme